MRSNLQSSPSNQSPEASVAGSSPFDIDDCAAYRVWRKAKLAGFPSGIEDCVVPIDDLAAPTVQEVGAIARSCARANFAIYALKKDAKPAEMRRDLPRFAVALGLENLDQQRSAKDDGIVALEVAQSGGRSGFIPFTDRPLNWHTDGYYNEPNAPVRAFILHCVRQAAAGGENQLLDPEIAYIRLRDEDPDLVVALMHPQAMTIPSHQEGSETMRPASVGPVFSIGEEAGNLAMRYTARSRNIYWRDDAATKAAAEFLSDLLRQGDPLMFRHCLQPGQGLVCNNILHARSNFEDAAASNATRLLYRMRFHQPVCRSAAQSN